MTDVGSRQNNCTAG